MMPTSIERFFERIYEGHDFPEEEREKLKGFLDKVVDRTASVFDWQNY